MEKLVLFLKIIAWISAPMSTIFLGLCVYMNIIYPGSIDEITDKLRGVKKTYPVFIWLVISIVAWAFLIAF